MGSTSSKTSGSDNNNNNNMADNDDNNSVLDFINKEISTHNVTIFSKSYCPYCKQTKSLFTMNKYQDIPISVGVHELDQMSNGIQIQSTLLNKTGQRTVPNVFINGEHIGGNDDTQNAHRTGKLLQLLQQQQQQS